MINPSKLPILVGPTGVGKSEIAFLLAKRLKAEIISADAFQVYRGLEVGTAQPPKEWQKEVPHHLVGIRDPQENWNAVEFAREAKKAIEGISDRKNQVLLVGGAGFYIRALVDGAPSGAAPTPEVRALVLEKIRELGNEKALAWLKERNPARAEKLHPNDIQRICRALEKTYETTPEKIEY
ncbi:MAG TPA: tRNA (adenosine(37)-N6)-dimethylallyltransferase MiaA, partial [bacterium]|nr:tRNA (adenosine(37)-N6)-dimethylallyltransferase MiaA [bacterium]